ARSRSQQRGGGLGCSLRGPAGPERWPRAPPRCSGPAGWAGRAPGPEPGRGHCVTSLRERTPRAQKRVVPMHPTAARSNHALGVDEVDCPAYRPVVLPRTIERGDLRLGIVEKRKRQPQLGLVTVMVVQSPRIDPEDGGVTGLERLPLLLQGGELAVAVWGMIPDVKHQDQVALAPILAEQYRVAPGSGQAEIRRLGAPSPRF